MKDIEGQISLFDMLGQSDKPDTDIQSYLKEAIMHGTGFVGGKERVYKLLVNNVLVNKLVIQMP